MTEKEVTEYVREEQTLDREERGALRDSQKRQAEDKKVRAQADVELAKVRAEVEEKKRADESHIKIQIAGCGTGQDRGR